MNFSSNFDILVESELEVNTKMSGNCFRRLVPVKDGFANGDLSAEELFPSSQVCKAIPFWKVADPSFDSLFPMEDMSPPVLLFLSFSCSSATEAGVGSCDEPMVPYRNEAGKLLSLGLLMLSTVSICSEFWSLAPKCSYSNRSGLAFV